MLKKISDKFEDSPVGCVIFVWLIFAGISVATSFGLVTLLILGIIWLIKNM